MSTILPSAASDGFSEPGLAAASVLDERRCDDRVSRDLRVTLIREDGSRIGPYPTDNLSESGLHVTVPVGYGLAVGQRYEVVLRDSNSPPSVRIDEGLYATVVRTQMRTETERNAIGVGLRLDQPLFL
ncbi:MAG: PilZ domain-containing protein [Phycisphaerales bacterium]|nr:PilZ domain-containing protein [Phycisphaerales bacterium]